MCSISANRTVDGQLEELKRSNDRRMIEERLYNFANEANIEQPGPLDAPARKMKRMPEDLRDVRKIRVGRHRIYYTGYHKQCSYSTIYIKRYKKSGVDDEDDKRFHNKLRGVLGEPDTHNLE